MEMALERLDGDEKRWLNYVWSILKFFLNIGKENPGFLVKYMKGIYSYTGFSFFEINTNDAF